MATHVIGIKPPNEKWIQMKGVYDACISADITIPKEVYDFFEGEHPNDKGVVINLDSNDGVSKLYNDCEIGYEIDLSKISKEITILQFINSW